MILPQLEQSSLYNQIDFRIGIERPQNSSPRLQAIATFLCPSDSTSFRWQAMRRDLSTGMVQGNICEVASANYVGVFGTFEPGVGGKSADGKTRDIKVSPDGSVLEID